MEFISEYPVLSFMIGWAILATLAVLILPRPSKDKYKEERKIELDKSKGESK